MSLAFASKLPISILLEIVYLLVVYLQVQAKRTFKRNKKMSIISYNHPEVFSRVAFLLNSAHKMMQTELQIVQNHDWNIRAV